MRKILVLLALFAVAMAEVNVGDIPSSCVIQSKDGGYVTGGDFNTSVLKGKINVLMYADPDEKDMGKELNKRLDALASTLDSAVYQKYLVINMEDTWKPNFLINSMLKTYQEKHPQSIFVKDERSVLSQAWGLDHDAYVCMIMDEKGTVIYRNKGLFSENEIQKIVALISKETQRLR